MQILQAYSAHPKVLSCYTLNQINCWFGDLHVIQALLGIAYLYYIILEVMKEVPSNQNTFANSYNKVIMRHYG